MMESGAVFSACYSYRYDLWRKWNSVKPPVLFIGLNPSTADENQNDATVRRCISFSRRWGFGGFHLANLFAYRTPHPSQLKLACDPVGPDNDGWLHRLLDQTDIWVLCWGNLGIFMKRDQSMRQLILSHGIQKAFYLARTRRGQPAHPLYLPAEVKLKPYSMLGN